MKRCEKPKLVTNSRYPTYTQTTFTAGDVDQFESNRKRSTLIAGNVNLDDNAFVDNPTNDYWFKYEKLDARAVSNTFEYLFYKFKKGIFVKIENNKLVNFLPFSNARYKNEFSDRIAVDPEYSDVREFLNRVSALSKYRPPGEILPTDEWTANNGMFRYEVRADEGDSNVEILKDMFSTLCESRNVPDAEFFVNRRDFPLLKTDGTEPYNHVYDSEYHPLVSRVYDEYAPILSGSVADRYADVAVPTYEDWARAKYQLDGTLFPNACRPYPKIESVPWKNKISTAVFRGASTGSGVTAKTNVRLKALSMADGKFLNAGITKWNLRPRKYEGDPYLRTIELRSYPTVEPLSLQQQSRFKYVLNLEGHVAAYRLSYELSSGSVVLLAESKWKMWYSTMLKPFVHYVPVSRDLSDLKFRVEWCRAHDAECAEIARNAKRFYDEYLGTNGILDFLQRTLVNLSTVTGSYGYVGDLLASSLESERKWLEEIPRTTVAYVHPLPLGPRCVERLDGCSRAFRSKSAKDFAYVKQLFKNKSGTVDLVKCNDVYFARKTATTAEKQREHDHECYVGARAVNALIAKVPNFAYVYGKAKDDESVYVEYVNGVVLFKWLTSDDFRFDAFLLLLYQINLALAVAQNGCGLVHYDLYPWNVVVQKLDRPARFDYALSSDVVVGCTTTLVPIIIDYGKSRAIVHEKEHGLIDHGFVNLYEYNGTLDTLTLLFSCLKLLKLEPYQRESLMEFVDAVGLKRDVAYYSKYGALFDARMIEVSPLTFLKHLRDKFGPLPEVTVADRDSYAMQRGNALLTEYEMLYGNARTAALNYIVASNRATRAESANLAFQRWIDETTRRRLKYVDAYVSRFDGFVKNKWAIVRKLYEYPQPKVTTELPTMTYPDVRDVNLDANVTPEELNSYDDLRVVPEDWITILDIVCEMTSTGVLPEDYWNVDNAAFLNAVAKSNTLLKIKKTMN